jgi:hypothetical protein
MKIIDTKVTHEGFHRLEVRTFEDEKHNVIFDRDILVAKDACAAFVYHKGRRQFAFVKQFRGGANMVTTECVAGIMDGVESPIDSITREIKEELGCNVIKSKYVDYVYIYFYVWLMVTTSKYWMMMNTLKLNGLMLTNYHLLSYTI